MELRISLMKHLEKCFEVLGWSKPEAVVEGGGKFVISIDFSNMSLPFLSLCEKKQHVFSGYYPSNSRISEYKAVMSVKRFLWHALSLGIHDLSHSKIIRLRSEMVEAVSKIDSLSTLVDRCIKEYQEAVNLLSVFASDIADDSIVVFAEILKSLSELIESVQSSIGPMNEQLAVLDGELSLERSSGSCSLSNAPVKHASIFFKVTEKDLLEDILDLLELPAAKYCTSQSRLGLFTATCTLFDVFSNETTKIEGEAKVSELDAESSAAAHVLLELEQSKNFVTVDFNYEEFCQLKVRHEQIIQLQLNYEELFYQVQQCWSRLARVVQKFSSEQYGFAAELFRSNDPFVEIFQ